MKKIYYVRHGLSEANVAGIASGAEENAKLVCEGQEQARCAGQNLKDKEVDLIVCSPLARTIETAQLIAGELGIDKDKILTNVDFVERRMGELSGRPHQEYREYVLSGKLAVGLESPEEMIIRIKRGFDWLAQQEGKNIILVSHGAVGRAVKVIHKNLHHDEMYRMDGFKNTEIYEFEL